MTFDEAGDGHPAYLDGGSVLYPKGCFTIGTIAGRWLSEDDITEMEGGVSVMTGR